MRVRASLAGALLLTLFCTAATAQETTFRVFQRGVMVGSTTITLAHEDQGWHLQGTGELKGTFQLVLRQLDIRYDDNWVPRIMTMELSSPEVAKPRPVPGASATPWAPLMPFTSRIR